jgi:hypothetical protein
MGRYIRRCVVAAAVIGSTLVPGTASASAGTAAVAAAPVTSIAVVYNINSGQAMVVKGASTANDALAVQYPYANNGVDNDVMVLEWVDYDNSDWVRIKPRHTYTNDGNVHNDKCLAVKGASMASGASIVQHTCTYDSANNDVWRAQLVRLSNGTFAYQFRNLNSNMCIAVRSASFTPGAELIQYACNGTTNSLWG